MLSSPRPIIGFAAYSGTGKTTLLEQVIPLLRSAGVRLAVIKHAHHRFDIDQPGKDSYRLRQAGAQQMLIASAQRSALMTENEREREPVLQELIQQLHINDIDLIIVEGFRHEAFPKIELHRPSLGKPLISASDDNIIAIASDAPETYSTQLPVLDINNPQQVAGFIQEQLLPQGAA
jgi:molybdopterin-guanine dinucleotide biosynthesis protein B